MADSTSYAEAEGGGFTISTENAIAVKIAAAMLPISDTAWKDVKNNLTGTLNGAPTIAQEGATGDIVEGARYVDFDATDDWIDMGQQYSDAILTGFANRSNASAHYVLLNVNHDDTGEPHLWGETDNTNHNFRFNVNQAAVGGGDYRHRGQSTTRTIINDASAALHGFGHSSPNASDTYQGYLDGIAADSGPGANAIAANAVNLTIGRNTTGGSVVSGKVYLLYAFNVELSAAEHDSLHTNPWQIFESGDTTAPSLSDPTADSVGATSVVPKCTTDEGNGTIYMVVVPDADAPTAAQVKAGQQSSGAAAIASANQAVSATGEQTFSQVTGLTESTSYELAFVHEDAAANLSTVTTIGFTTLASGGPDITTPPTLDSATATAYTVDLGVVDEDATAYLGVYAPGATPTAANIKAGTSANGVQSQAVLANVAFGTVTLTPTPIPPWPYSSIKIVYEGTGGFSAITTLSKSYLAAPAGKQFQELNAGPYAAWLSDPAVDPAAVAADVLIWDLLTDPGGYEFVVLADGNFSYDSGSDTSRQTGVRELWRVADQSFSGEQIFAVNNQPPSVPDLGVDLERFENIPFANYNALALGNDPEDDVVTFDQSPDDLQALPPGTTIVAGEFVTDHTLLVAGVYPVIGRWTDEFGDWAEADFIFTDINTETMPDVDDGDLSEAAAITAIETPGLQSPTVFTGVNELVAVGNVFAQDPPAGTIHPVTASTSITVSVEAALGGGYGFAARFDWFFMR